MQNVSPEIDNISIIYISAPERCNSNVKFIKWYHYFSKSVLCESCAESYLILWSSPLSSCSSQYDNISNILHKWCLWLANTCHIQAPYFLYCAHKIYMRQNLHFSRHWGIIHFPMLGERYQVRYNFSVRCLHHVRHTSWSKCIWRLNYHHTILLTL